MASAGPPLRGKIRELEEIVKNARELMAKVGVMIGDSTLDPIVKIGLIEKQYELEKSLDAAQAEIDANDARQKARKDKGPPFTLVPYGGRRRSKSRRRRRTLRK
jgi:hypothetical protein